MKHRRPKAGDASPEGLLKVERRVFRCLGVWVFRCLGIQVFRCFGVLVFWCFGFRVQGLGV